MRRLALACLMSVCLRPVVLLAGDETQSPAFEAADIKLNLSGPGESRGDIVDGRLMIRNASLRVLIAEAWMLTPDEVLGPSWLDDVRVDIVAKAASAKTADKEVRLMIQTLLKDRMNLRVHSEQKEETVWALTTWKQPKMKPSEMPAKPEDASCSRSGDAAELHLHCTHLPMSLLALKLPYVASETVDRRVVDQTGLDGAWEVNLDWSPRAQIIGDGLTLFAALQAQLGLQLTNRKLPMDVLFVDNMDHAPSDN